MTDSTAALAEANPISDARAAFLWDEQDRLIYKCTVSAAYHGKRERFFGVMERVMQALTAITATAAFADIAGKDGGFAKWLALVAAVSSILPLVFGFADRARQHGQLSSQFKALLADMYKAGVEWNEGQLSEFKSRVAKLEAGEPTSLAALVIHCQNEIAVGKSQDVYPLKPYEVALMHFYGFDGARIIGRGAKPASRDVASPKPAA